ncbi:MAG: PilN domain-containing protein [Deltaproteobacteria bacterium]|nr:PilN domain-containing protein [Deltaproteobacteria bacterium]
MALREINLIPGDILDRRYLLRHLGFWAGCMVISLSLVFGFYFYQAKVALAKERPMTTLEDMHMNLGTRIEEIKGVQDELERLDQQQSVLKTITRNQSYSRVLHTLADIMNEDTWLRRLTIDQGKGHDEDEENVTRLKLTGLSFSNEELGNFVNRLSAEPMFKRVILKFARETITALSRQNADESMRVVEFQIECHI